MDILSYLVTLLFTFVTVIRCEVAHMDQGQQGAGRPSLHDKTHVHDASHIKEHYNGVLDEEENLSDDELNFHYFKVHDYDNNGKLDGIELISALTHYHSHKDDSPEEPRMPDQELTNMIDQILEEDDTNGDGYIDYAEFILSQKR